MFGSRADAQQAEIDLLGKRIDHLDKTVGGILELMKDRAESLDAQLNNIRAAMRGLNEMVSHLNEQDGRLLNLLGSLEQK